MIPAKFLFLSLAQFEIVREVCGVFKVVSDDLIDIGEF
jgi:hypothetical protein